MKILAQAYGRGRSEFYSFVRSLDAKSIHERRKQDHYSVIRDSPIAPDF